MIKSQKDFWSGVMFVAIGVVFAIGARNYSFGDAARPGPGYFPFGLGLMLALLGAAIVVNALRGRRGDTPEGDPIGAWAWRPVLIIVLAVCVFAAALPRLGLIVSLPLLVLIASFAGDEFHWGEVAANAAILTIGSYFVFIRGLGLTIPVWPTFVA